MSARGTPFKFQFPTNGKAYPKAVSSEGSGRRVSTVSIPYEREGISKDIHAASSGNIGFILFQFPTNGKVYPKSTLTSCASVK